MIYCESLESSEIIVCTFWVGRLLSESSAGSSEKGMWDE